MINNILTNHEPFTSDYNRFLSQVRNAGAKRDTESNLGISIFTHPHKDNSHRHCDLNSRRRSNGNTTGIK